MQSTSTRTDKGPLRSPMHSKIFVKNNLVRVELPKDNRLCPMHYTSTGTAKGQKVMPDARVRTAMYSEKVKIFIGPV